MSPPVLARTTLTNVAASYSMVTSVINVALMSIIAICHLLMMHSKPTTSLKGSSIRRTISVKPARTWCTANSACTTRWCLALSHRLTTLRALTIMTGRRRGLSIWLSSMRIQSTSKTRGTLLWAARKVITRRTSLAFKRKAKRSVVAATTIFSNPWTR